MFILNDKTKENIEKRTGIKFKSIPNMDFIEVDRMIEKKIGKNLSLPKSSNKFLDINIVDKILSKI